MCVIYNFSWFHIFIFSYFLIFIFFIFFLFSYFLIFLFSYFFSVRMEPTSNHIVTPAYTSRTGEYTAERLAELKKNAISLTAAVTSGKMHIKKKYIWADNTRVIYIYCVI